ncbi:MAG: hypothetical protein JO337_05650 [Acidimicrobiales bacterium]|nr:hypothetical protein [Acidimicrobiales bacterium]
MTGEGLRAIVVPSGAHFVGILTVLVAAWGAIGVFIGPAFDWTPTSDSSWTWNTQNWMLHLLPGAVAFVGGLMILMASPRRLAGGRSVIDLAALMVVACGAWFVIGPALWATFESGTPFQGAGPTNEFWYQLGSSLGPGLVLAFLGGMALKAGIARPGMAVAEPVDEPVAGPDRAAAAAEPSRTMPERQRPATTTQPATGPTSG